MSVMLLVIILQNKTWWGQYGKCGVYVVSVICKTWFNFF